MVVAGKEFFIVFKLLRYIKIFLRQHKYLPLHSDNVKQSMIVGIWRKQVLNTDSGQLRVKLNNYHNPNDVVDDKYIVFHASL